ncbi:hypothetical protein HMPREF0240_04216 [Clostridium sp. D5]|nr:hypothetical protein HMPREF0240_04216 [Clostridium sp. D5]
MKDRLPGRVLCSSTAPLLPRSVPSTPHQKRPLNAAFSERDYFSTAGHHIPDALRAVLQPSRRLRFALIICRVS